MLCEFAKCVHRKILAHVVQYEHHHDFVLFIYVTYSNYSMVQSLLRDFCWKYKCDGTRECPALCGWYVMTVCIYVHLLHVPVHNYVVYKLSMYFELYSILHIYTYVCTCMHVHLFFTHMYLHTLVNVHVLCTCICPCTVYMIIRSDLQMHSEITDVRCTGTCTFICVTMQLTVDVAVSLSKFDSWYTHVIYVHGPFSVQKKSL